MLHREDRQCAWMHLIEHTSYIIHDKQYSVRDVDRSVIGPFDHYCDALQLVLGNGNKCNDRKKKKALLLERKQAMCRN